MLNFPNWICIFNKTPIKMLKSYFVNIDRIILKFTEQRCDTEKEPQRTRTTWLEDATSLVKGQTQRWMGQKSPGTDPPSTPDSQPSTEERRPSSGQTDDADTSGTTGCPRAERKQSNAGCQHPAKLEGGGWVWVGGTAQVQPASTTSTTKKKRREGN